MSNESFFLSKTEEFTLSCSPHTLLHSRYYGIIMYEDRVSFLKFASASEGCGKIRKPFGARAASMEPADRTRYIEGRLTSISKRFFVLHGLEKHISQTLEELCLGIVPYCIILHKYCCIFQVFSYFWRLLPCF